MNILFLHRSFPSQFKFPAIALSLDPRNNVVFITNDPKTEIPGIKKFAYEIEQKPSSNKLTSLFETDVLHGEAAAQVAISLREQGFVPDIIIGHSWGTSLFIKDIFPNTPFICYFEWFNRTKDSFVDFDGNEPSLEEKEMIQVRNARVLLDLNSCDAALTPTHWQKQQFPKEYQDKISVIHDGIDTNLCKPDDNAKFIINDKIFTRNDEVITYATRGLEPMRGFPEFMRATEKLLKLRPNAHFIIAGKDKVTYGKSLKQGTYKELMLKELNMDLNRVHFVDYMEYHNYLNLLKISSAHIYLTYPFILSWSFMEAMSCACPIIGSKTAPVEELMQDGVNGLLTDFFNVDELVEKIVFALDNKEEMDELRQNARTTIVEKYSMEHCLQEQLKLIYNTIALYKNE